MNRLFDTNQYQPFMSVGCMKWGIWWRRYDPPNATDFVWMMVVDIIIWEMI